MTDLLRRRIAESDEFAQSSIVVLDDLRAPEILDLPGQLDLVRRISVRPDSTVIVAEI